MARKFEELDSEQTQLAARMFWGIIESFVYEAETGMLVTFCTRSRTHGEYASLSTFFNERGLQCSIADLFISVIEHSECDFADLIKHLVLEKVQEEIETGV